MGQAKMVTHEHEGTAADAAAERQARKERQERQPAQEGAEEAEEGAQEGGTGGGEEGCSGREVNWFRLKTSSHTAENDKKYQNYYKR